MEELIISHSVSDKAAANVFTSNGGISPDGTALFSFPFSKYFLTSGGELSFHQRMVLLCHPSAMVHTLD